MFSLRYRFFIVNLPYALPYVNSSVLPQLGLAGPPLLARASAHAILVLAIFLENIFSNASAMLSGGPPSMMDLSGKPWLSILDRLRGRDKLT